MGPSASNYECDCAFIHQAVRGDNVAIISNSRTALELHDQFAGTIAVSTAQPGYVVFTKRKVAAELFPKQLSLKSSTPCVLAFRDVVHPRSRGMDAEMAHLAS